MWYKYMNFCNWFLISKKKHRINLVKILKHKENIMILG